MAGSKSGIVSTPRASRCTSAAMLCLLMAAVCLLKQSPAVAAARLPRSTTISPVSPPPVSTVGLEEGRADPVHHDPPRMPAVVLVPLVVKTMILRGVPLVPPEVRSGAQAHLDSQQHYQVARHSTTARFSVELASSSQCSGTVPGSCTP